MAEWIVPTDARAEYRKLIQRANRRILSNLKYIKEEGIRDNDLKTSLAGDYFKKRSWSTKTAPLSSSTKFKSEADYKAFIRFVNRWGEDTGRRGGYRADPKEKLNDYRESLYKAIFGLSANKGISLEEWGGDIPPEMKKQIESLSLEQMKKFFEYTNESGEDEIFDSDQVSEESDNDFINYLQARLGEVQKFFPKKTKKRKKSRRKTKGRKRK